jgi:hypothetical protein
MKYLREFINVFRIIGIFELFLGIVKYYTKSPALTSNDLVISGLVFLLISIILAFIDLKLIKSEGGES